MTSTRLSHETYETVPNYDENTIFPTKRDQKIEIHKRVWDSALETKNRVAMVEVEEVNDPTQTPQMSSGPRVP